MGKNRNKFKQEGGVVAGQPASSAGVAKRGLSATPGSGGARAAACQGSGAPAGGSSRAAAVASEDAGAEPSGRDAAPPPSTEGPPFRLAVQPVKSKYGGMGFAKPSVFINLHDATFDDKFEAVFYEHVKGWAGFSYTKTRKKEEQKGMLWKQRLLAKQGKPVPQAAPAAAAAAPPAGLTKKQRRRLLAEQEIMAFKD
eukprot:jgi/Tetstr1/426429/TSEL_001625.t1